MKRLDAKLAGIRSGQYRRTDFIIAGAKDSDMGSSLTGAAPHRQPDGTWARYRTRAEFLDQIAAIVRQDIVDIMLVSASNLERLNERDLFRNSAVKHPRGQLRHRSPPDRRHPGAAEPSSPTASARAGPAGAPTSSIPARRPC
ncbi:MAG TPA: hypothetical protein VFG64_18585 [Dongiaceae bacterium]|nr:hypothetical protein [Dongiaceae bacterium]